MEECIFSKIVNSSFNTIEEALSDIENEVLYESMIHNDFKECKTQELVMASVQESIKNMQIQYAVLKSNIRLIEQIIKAKLEVCESASTGLGTYIETDESIHEVFSREQEDELEYEETLDDIFIEEEEETLDDIFNKEDEEYFSDLISEDRDMTKSKKVTLPELESFDI